MVGYVKRIAVIKQLKGGFSADGGPLSGIVKAEMYAGFLKVEASLINFAPLSEGRYVIGISDGVRVVTFDAPIYEGEEQFDLQNGFAAVVCFCNNGAYPIASAYCGDRAFALIDVKNAIEKEENVVGGKVAGGDVGYDDQAIAEENYYEYENTQSGGAVCEDKEEKADGVSACENEKAVCLSEKEGLNFEGEGKAEDVAYCDKQKSQGGDGCEESKDYDRAGEVSSGDLAGGNLAGGNFYNDRKEIIENLFKTFPKEEELCGMIENSQWVKISYGENSYYVFGVIYDEGRAAYICYGVPSANEKTPPKSLAGRASYIPVKSGGYWVMYQDAATGATIPVEEV